MKILVTGDRLQQYESSIFGNIYVQLNDGFCFPDEHWTDFVDLVLSMWRSSCDILLQQQVDEANFSFMDGPFALLVTRVQGNQATCNFVRCGETLVDLRSIEIDLVEFMQCIHEAIERLSELATKYSIQSTELDCLSKRILGS